MRKENTTVLEATSVHYYSMLDEDAFFEWLIKLDCVHSYKGHVRTLYIVVDHESVDDEALGELLALFRRYDVDLGQLRALDSDRIGPWFRNPAGSWYGPIFGSDSPA